MSEFKTLFIKDLLLDQKYQARSRMDPQVIKDYEGLISEGVEMPPIKVVSIQNQLYVVDGFHRVHAYRNQGRDRIETEVIESTAQDALILAIRANQEHGLRRSVQDKNKTVEMALENIELEIQSDRQLAKLCGVSQPFVSSVRARMDKPKSLSKFARKTQIKAQLHEVKELSPPAPFVESDFDAKAELVELLEKENQQLKDSLALGFANGSADDKDLYQQTLEELRGKLRIAEIEIDAVKRSRDMYQSENSELKKQCVLNQRVIKKLNDQLGKSA